MSVPSCDRSPTCGRFVDERHAYTPSGTAALATARHSSANVNSVTFTADVEIRKLKSDLFLQAIINAFLKGEGTQACDVISAGGSPICD